jgi:WD40 repeat protein
VANVFISHAGEDSRPAAELREWLVADGHDVFLDRDLRDGIAVGDEWEHLLHERLRWADATVCLVTTAYVNSAWCMAEVAIGRSRGSKLLPVLAEAGPEHPLMGTLQYTDMTRDPAHARDALAAALRRIDRTGGLGWPDDRSPFPGLRPFDADLHQVFFGRKEDVEALAELLRSPAERAHNAILLVVGPSGCGKSSLVRAGLLPRMADEPDWWTLPAFTPGVDPEAALARELAALARETEGGRQFGDIKRELAAGRVVDVVDELLLETPGRRRKRLLVVIDQLEELLIQTPADKRAAFAALLRAALGGPVDVVATLRPEFLDQLLVDPDLATLPMHPRMVRPLRRETLRTVVEGPTRLAGLRVSDELVAKLVDDTDSGEALPLLAFTLAQLADGVVRGGELSMRRYDELGGVQGALIRQANLALADAVAATGRGRDDVIAGLLRVVTVDEHNRPTRWHVRRDDLPAPVSAELDAFVARRLLTIDTVNGEAMVSASHEKFFTTWPPLDEAIKAAASALRARRSIEESAAEWDVAGRPSEALWERGRLSAAITATGVRVRARKVTAERVDISPVGREFVHAGVRRNRSRRRNVVGAASALLVMALVAGVIAFVQQRTAADRQRQADEQALLATARQLVSKAEAALHSNPRTALMLNVAAHRIHPDAETYASLQTALTTTPYAGQLTGVKSTVDSVAYSPGGRYLAAGFQTGAVMLWDLQDPLRPRQVGEPFRFQDFHGGVVVGFAGDNRLVAAGTSGSVTIFDLTEPERPRPLGNPVVGKSGREGGAWLSPDGTVLATSNKEDPRLRLWDLTDPAQPRPLGPPLALYPKEVRAVAFSADGTMIATSGPADTDMVQLFDFRQREAPRLVGRIAPAPADIVDSLSFSADGRMLAVGGFFRGTGLWDVSDAATPRPARDLLRVGMGSKVWFSPQGATLATTAGRDTGLLLWNTSDRDFPRRTETLIAGEDDRSLAFSPDGRVVASGSGDGRVTLWNLRRAGGPRAYGPPFVGHKGEPYQEVYALAMSDDGTMVATGGRDTTVVLWDVTDPARPRQVDALTGHTGTGVEGVVFSPDGKLLASGDSEENVILWDLTDRDHPRPWAAPLKTSTGITRSIMFSADGKTLVVGGDSGAVFWDVREPDRPVRLAQVLEEDGVLMVSRTADGRMLAVVRGTGSHEPDSTSRPVVPTTTGGGQDRNSSGEERSGGEGRAGPAESGPGDPNGARLWDITDPRDARQVGSALVGHEAAVATAAISPEGNLLVTGDGNGAVILWDLKDPAKAHRLGDPLAPHGTLSQVAVRFAPTADILVTAGIEGNAYLWDLGNRILPRQLGPALADNPDAITHVRFSSDGNTLATSGSDGDVVLWDMRPTYDVRARLDETACRVTAGGLNRDQWVRYLPDLEYRDTCGR